MRCEDCKWWDNSTQHRDAQPDTTGLCRHNTPTADERDHKAVWPFTTDTDWCFSFAEREEGHAPYDLRGRADRLERDLNDRVVKINEWERFLTELYALVPSEQRKDWPKRPASTDDISF